MLENFEKAIEKYEAACKIFPNEMTYMLNIAACYLEQKDFDKWSNECLTCIRFRKVSTKMPMVHVVPKDLDC